MHDAVAVRLLVLLAASLTCLAAAAAPRAAAAQGAPAARASARVLRKLQGVDSTQTVTVRTRDGSALVGRVLAVQGDTLRFSAGVGTVAIPLGDVEDVLAMSRAAGPRAGGAQAYWFRNPNATRLLFAPTGRMLERGDGYFSDYYVVLPGFAYGVTDELTLGGGMSLIPGLNGSQVFYFTPKVGLYQSPNTNLAAGALVAAYPGGDGEESHTFGILYGVGTLGGPDGSVTAGLGYGYADGELGDKPAVLLGAEKRLSRRTALVTENYVLPGVDDPLISYGLRFFGEQSSLDLGFVNVLGEDAIFPGIPYVGFVFNF